MKPEQCKGCGYFRYGEFCTKFSVPISDLHPSLGQIVFVPIVCIPECEYAKGKS